MAVGLLSQSGYKWVMWRSLWWWTWFGSWIYQCQYPGYVIGPTLCKILPLVEIDWRVHGMCLYYFFRLHMIWQLQQNKKHIKKIRQCRIPGPKLYYENKFLLWKVTPSFKLGTQAPLFKNYYYHCITSFKFIASLLHWLEPPA